MIEFLLNLDTDAFLAVNSWHTPFFDSFMFLLSCKYFWAPLYVVFIYLVFKEYGKKGFLVVAAAIFLIVLSDQTSVWLFKNVFQRLRPCHNPDLAGMVHLVNDQCGGAYGFISSHAVNTFAGGVFILSLLGKKYGWLLPVVVFWFLSVIYSRVYLGVHYPADVMAGAIWGSFLGLILARFAKNLAR